MIITSTAGVLSSLLTGLDVRCAESRLLLRRRGGARGALSSVELYTALNQNVIAEQYR